MSRGNPMKPWTRWRSHKKLAITAVTLVILVAGGPDVYWRLRGWWRDEPTFLARPASYWSWTLRDWVPDHGLSLTSSSWAPATGFSASPRRLLARLDALVPVHPLVNFREHPAVLR